MAHFAIFQKGYGVLWNFLPTSEFNEAGTGSLNEHYQLQTKAATCYLEGCTAPQRDENQLHAAVVELVALDDEIKTFRYAKLVSWRCRRKRRSI